MTRIPLLVYLCFPAALAAQPHARVSLLVPESAPKSRTAVARILQDCVYKATGARVPLVSQIPPEGLVIHIGRSPVVDQFGLGLENLHNDGYVLKGIDKRTYVIAGPTESGTEFGIYEFLERYLGVRWLLPGDIGTDIPKRTSLVVPPDEIRQEPAFISRELSGLGGRPEHAAWARRNRMSISPSNLEDIHPAGRPQIKGRLRIQQDLYRVYRPSLYTGPHPELFPLLDGKRYLPTSDSDHNWQPDFTAPGAAETAVSFFKEYFRSHPAEGSASLGINDSTRFSESPATIAVDGVRLNAFGFRSASESYYSWCNQVIEGVLREFPDKYFTCLAYVNVAEPPIQSKPHPRLVPFLTQERLMWLDPAAEQKGKDLTKRWAQLSPLLGWYDYVYGSPYCLPRVFSHQMAEVLRWGRSQGVRAYCAELYPNWGEGPKPYLLLKLLWDPSLDVDAVLADWYTRCVGDEAAPRLKEYFDSWEQFWMHEVPSSPWWRTHSTYLPLDADPSYLARVSDARLQRCRELLADCIRLAQTPAQRRRAEFLQRTFEYYESTVNAYRCEALAYLPMSNSADALNAAGALETGLKAAQHRLTFVKSAKSDALLMQPLSILKYPRLLGENWGTPLIGRLLPWAAKDPQVRAHLARISLNAGEPLRPHLAAVEAITSGKAVQVSRDASFESEPLNPWWLWQNESIHRTTLGRSSERALTGRNSIRCEDLKLGGPHQTLSLPPGRYAAAGYVFTPASAAARSKVELRLLHGNPSRPTHREGLESLVVPGEWICLLHPFTLTRPSEVTLAMYVRSNGADDPVFIDDLAIWRVDSHAH